MILPYVRTENECQKERCNRLKKKKLPWVGQLSRMTCWDGPSSSQPGDHKKRSNLEAGEIRHKSAGMKTSYPSTNNAWPTWTTWHSGCLMLTHITVDLNHVLPFLHRYAQCIETTISYRSYTLCLLLGMMPVELSVIKRKFHHHIICDHFQRFSESLKNIKR